MCRPALGSGATLATSTGMAWTCFLPPAVIVAVIVYVPSSSQVWSSFTVLLVFEVVGVSLPVPSP